MQKKAEANESRMSATSIVNDCLNVIKNVNKKVLSSIVATVMLISSFGIITKYYTLGYNVYYEDVNVGVISSKAEAMEAYTEAKSDVAQCKKSDITGNLSFIMTIAPVSEIADSDVYSGIVEAAEGKESCYSIETADISVAKLKTKTEAEEAVAEYVASYKRDDASVYTDYKIIATKDIVTEIVDVDEAVARISDSGLFTVVYKDVIEEEFEIPFKEVIMEDELMPKGKTVVKQQGVAGKGVRRAVIFYENGIKKHDVEPIVKLISEPVERITVIGTGEMVGLMKNSLPWPTKGVFTSKFGPRWGRNHNGVDIAASPGTPIHAPAPGKVIFSGTKNGYGNYIMIDHGNGFVSTYAHMTTRYAQVGDVVSEGDLIGTVGSTGNVTGPHLHFEIKLNDSFVDPMIYIAG